MNTPRAHPSRALVVIDLGYDASPAYSLAEAARIAGMHPNRLRHYCRLGFFGTVLSRAEAEPVFDDDHLYEARRLEHFRRHHRVDHQTLRLLAGLWREVELLRTEVARHRDQTTS